ncbi:MAG: cytochrome c [Pseudomonadota bacterium]
MNKTNSLARVLAVVTGMTLALALASPVQAEGDPESGKKLSYTCLGCHGIDGYRNPYPSYRVPMLGGQHEDYIVIALKAYRSGERSHATMKAQAGSLSDQDIADIAAYFASRGELKVGAAVTTKGKELTQACTACHGETGASANAIWPNLAGQHKDYLINALKQYRLANKEETNGIGQRNNAIMAGLAGTLSDDDIAAVAEYYSSQQGLFTTEHE